MTLTFAAAHRSQLLASPRNHFLAWLMIAIPAALARFSLYVDAAPIAGAISCNLASLASVRLGVIIAMLS